VHGHSRRHSQEEQEKLKHGEGREEVEEKSSLRCGRLLHSSVVLLSIRDFPAPIAEEEQNVPIP